LRQRTEVSAVHLGLTAKEAYAVLRDFETHVELADVVRSVRLEPRDDGSQISFWEIQLKRGVLRWSQVDELDDANHRVRFHKRDGDAVEFKGEWSAVDGPEGCRIGFDCEFDLGIEASSERPDPLAARIVRESITEHLEGVFGTELLVDRSAPREPVAVAGI
jgi:hypothetical protein